MRAGAAQLISNYQLNSKPIRHEDTIHKHYRRMMEHGMIPEEFIQSYPHDSPPLAVIPFRNKRICCIHLDTSNRASSSARQSDIEPGDIPQDEQPSSNSNWLQGNFKLPVEKVAAVIDLAKKIQLTEQHAGDALQTADHLRRTKAGNESTHDPVVSHFFSIINKQEGNSSVGSLTFLLLVACLAFTGNIRTGCHLVGEFLVEGKESRNWETLRKTVTRKKSLIAAILITDS